MMYFKSFCVTLFFLLSYCCSRQSQLETQITQTSVQYQTFRYDSAFYGSTSQDLPKLKSKFPYLFPKQFQDSLWVKKIKDTLIQSLAGEVVHTFKDFKLQKAALKSFFQHMKYYFPAYKVPNVVTVISEVDYRNKVIYADSLLLLGLDNYLGKDHRYYEGIYDYIKQSMNPSDLIVDVAEVHINRIVPRPRKNTFITYLIKEGEKLYLKDLLIPQLEDYQKIKYTEKQWDWAETNENMVWRYFIEKEMLYSTNHNLYNRFISEAPFSKFYLSIDNDSPPRIGQYIGWKIVKSFMKNHQVSFKELIQMDSQNVFSKSKYKPLK